MDQSLEQGSPASLDDPPPDSLSQLITISYLYSENIQRPSAVFMNQHHTSSSISSESAFSTKELIQEVLEDEQQRERLLKCRGRDAQSLLNLFQILLDTCSMVFHLNLHLKLNAMTKKLAVESGLYPGFYHLENVVVSEIVECFGRCSNIHKGEWNGCTVCAKVGRRYQNTDMAHSNYFESVINEAFLWRQLHHPNILPFYGIHPIKNQIFLIAPWMENGDITEYLKRNQTSTRSTMVEDVAQGLKYLHENRIVHRDLKGKNILVNEKGRAVLTDFGASVTLNDTSSLLSASCTGTVRWQAPELFDTDNYVAHNFTASDVYAFGMVCFEIYTGQIPFARIKRDLAIKWQVLEGKRPTRPVEYSDSWSRWGLNEDMWDLMEACWRAQPAERPTIQEVVGRFEPNEG